MMATRLRKTALAFVVLAACVVSTAANLSAATGAMVVVLIDTSSSAKESDPGNLRRAALELLSALTHPSTRLALIGFDEKARVLLPPTAMGPTGSKARRRVHEAGRTPGAEGGKAISKALKEAGSLIGAEPDATVILLSDSKSTEDRWSDQSGMVSASTVVHAVALSKQADRNQLEAIARKTGGVFESARTADDLARVFSTLLARAQGEEIILLRQAWINRGDVREHVFNLEPGASTAYVALAWLGGGIDLRLIAPDGQMTGPATAVASGKGVEGETNRVIRLKQPEPGRWKIEVKAAQIDSKGEPYTLLGGVAGGGLRFDWKLADASAGTPIIFAPRASKAVRWLRTRATVRDSNSRIVLRGRVPYRGEAGFVIPAIEKPGDYLIRLEIDGEIIGGGRFSRVFDRTIAIGRRRTTAEPAAASRPTAGGEPAYVNPNALVLQLAPGHRDAYGLEDDPSVDLDIRFAYDAAKLEKVSTRQLDALGEALAADALRDARFEIIGHTDAKGATGYNQTLSERRAEAVRTYLLDRFKVDAALITALGRGEHDLKDTLFPEAAINRRVEVRVISKPLAQPASPKPVVSAPSANSGTGTINWGAAGARSDATTPDQPVKKSGGKIKW